MLQQFLILFFNHSKKKKIYIVSVRNMLNVQFLLFEYLQDKKYKLQWRRFFRFSSSGYYCDIRERDLETKRIPRFELRDVFSLKVTS